MASNINTTNIDQAYPVAGIDNDSQGFRDNYTNIVTNLETAKTEITDLQATIDTVEDVDTTTVAPVIGQTLLWDGTNWVPGAGGATSNKPRYEKAIATAGQTIFPTTVSTVATTADVDGEASLQVFRNGVLQEEGGVLDFYVSGANMITFTSGLTLNDIVIIYTFA